MIRGKILYEKWKNPSKNEAQLYPKLDTALTFISGQHLETPMFILPIFSDNC